MFEYMVYTNPMFSIPFYLINYPNVFSLKLVGIGGTFRVLIFSSLFSPSFFHSLFNENGVHDFMSATMNGSGRHKGIRNGLLVTSYSEWAPSELSHRKDGDP